jgi:hypothetical protein
MRRPCTNVLYVGDRRWSRPGRSTPSDRFAGRVTAYACRAAHTWNAHTRLPVTRSSMSQPSAGEPPRAPDTQGIGPLRPTVPPPEPTGRRSPANLEPEAVREIFAREQVHGVPAVRSPSVAQRAIQAFGAMHVSLERSRPDQAPTQILALQRLGSIRMQPYQHARASGQPGECDEHRSGRRAGRRIMRDHGLRRHGTKPRDAHTMGHVNHQPVPAVRNAVGQYGPQFAAHLLRIERRDPGCGGQLPQQCALARTGKARDDHQGTPVDAHGGRRRTGRGGGFVRSVHDTFRLTVVDLSAGTPPPSPVVARPLNEPPRTPHRTRIADSAAVPA